MAERTETNLFHVFGYGSLMFEPEAPQHVVNILPARLKGYRRAFCKASRARGCARDESFNAFPGLHGGAFARPGFNLSLVLGTLAEPGAAIDGMILFYPTRVRSHVITALDRREGYNPIHPIDNHYIRRRHTIMFLSTQFNAEAIVYFWDENPDGDNHLGELEIDTVARALINATPRRPDGGDALGVHYLEGVRDTLRGASLRDPYLEEVAAAIHRLPGPWVERVKPPHRAA